MVLLIDNYDSFTFNVAHYLTSCGHQVEVKRNDEISIDEIRRMAPTHIVISPGPCTPNEAGISQEVVRSFAGSIPILGVCLGHQTIAHVFGASIVRAPVALHGKTSLVHHLNCGVFTELPSPMRVARYHSLVVDPETVPDELQVTAWTLDKHGERDQIMGIRHKTLDIEGVQFHPEAILTEHGHAVFDRFLNSSSQ
jgi:anthranilate synthase/aminodeoxychorismate synthase-like glutamine amidotransferase